MGVIPNKLHTRSFSPIDWPPVNTLDKSIRCWNPLFVFYFFTKMVKNNDIFQILSLICPI